MTSFVVDVALACEAELGEGGIGDPVTVLPRELGCRDSMTLDVEGKRWMTIGNSARILRIQPIVGLPDEPVTISNQSRIPWRTNAPLLSGYSSAA